MLPPISPCFALLSLLLLSLSSHTTTTTTHDDDHPFLHCLHHRSTPSNLIHTPNTTSYSSLLSSSTQNLRLVTTTSPTPLFILTPTLESLVRSSVLCARAHGLRLRVRSGGHDYEGLSYLSRDATAPFIILDLRNLRSINIDATHRLAWVQAGATLGEMYYRIAQTDDMLGFPAGVCPTVGVGGHFSGGGIGTMVRAFGLAADHVVDARLVSADGEILDRSSMGEDLFWAIIGGGGASFGVILSYKIKLVQVPSKVTVFTKSKTLNQGATRLVTKWQQIAHKVDHKLFIRAILQVVGGEEVMINRTIQASFNSLFLGEREELLSLMGESFDELGLESDDCEEMSWIESVLYFAGYNNGEDPSVLLNRTLQFKSSYKAKSDFVREPISEMGWERIWSWILDDDDERPIVIVDPFGGRMDEISENETPFPHRRGSLYNIQYLVKWGDEGGGKKHVDWMRRFYGFMGTYVSKNPRAAYLNYRDLDLGKNEGGGVTSYLRARVWGRRYFKGNFKRLACVKSLVDPNNFFRNEQSIPPLFLP